MKNSRRRRWLGSLNYIRLHFFTNTYQPTDRLPPSTPQQLSWCPQWFVSEHTAGNPLGASQLTLVGIIITLGYSERRHKCIWCFDAIHLGEYECLFSRGFCVSRLPWACLKGCYVGVRSPPSTCFSLYECAFVLNWFSWPVFRMWHCLSICTTAIFSLIKKKKCLGKKTKKKKNKKKKKQDILSVVISPALQRLLSCFRILNVTTQHNTTLCMFIYMFFANTIV